MLPFALTIFTGAFLLFQVQPIIGKYILPWFGGSPGVWTTCMLFFQVLLLAGYAYAHITSTYLKQRHQVMVHVGLLILAVAFLPITPSESWQPSNGGDPVGRILLLLAASLGLPYFVLSSTGPLIQKWFSLTHPGRSPYRLYALSNIGSLLALISYPFYVESSFSRQQQAVMWSVGLCIFVLVCAYCAFRLWTHSSIGKENPLSEPRGAVVKPLPMDRFMWLVLPMTASVLLIATTTKLCQDVAVVPFLWVLPLSLYLLSFILCFDHSRWYQRGLFSGLLALAAVVVCHLLFAGHGAPLLLQISGYASAMFIACMVCHGELYRLKPATDHLTGYYLMIAAGGALGGILVALVAPLVFSHYVELQIGFWLLCYLTGYLCLRDESRPIAYGAAAGLIAGGLLLPFLREEVFSEGLLRMPVLWAGEFWDFHRIHWKAAVIGLVALLVCFGDHRRLMLREWAPRMGGFVMLLTLGLGILMMHQFSQSNRYVLTASRNFYGMLKVVQYNASNPLTTYHTMVHGGITHGMQFTDPVLAAFPTTYYGESSGVGRALRQLERAGGRRIGLVGLGTGSLATYGEPGDNLRIYEINPAVEKLARNHFTYLNISEAEIDVVMGDARLSMEQELRAGEVHRFDLLALDAFSSDAIPVHLLTTEAFSTYLDCLAPGGVIAVHISNRYLDLQPVIENVAEHFGLEIATIMDEDPEDWWVYRTTWILLSGNLEFMERPEIADERTAPSGKAADVRLWTDDYASLFEVLK